MGLGQLLLGSLCAVGLLSSQVSAVPAESNAGTSSSGYKFSSVAITGGGFITGIVARNAPSFLALIYSLCIV
jgi:hypothetical protein